MALIPILQEICSLQPHYSSENISPMQRRGVLIRSALPDAVRAFEADLRNDLEEFGDDFIIDASDGIGRKTEAPWVRVASKRMSGSAREGFYLVVHFSRDGSAFWITIGFGSTLWTNGELRPFPDEELARRRSWARQEISHRFGTLAPFEDVISLGASANLPRVFEKATAIARRFDPATASESDIVAAIRDGVKRLVPLYRGQTVGANLTGSQLAEIEIEEVSNPVRAGSNAQGFGLSGPERRVIELRAMALAREWLLAHGYTARDCSATASYDFAASRDGRELKVEVKGTTSSALDGFVMTRNEVELHTREQGETILILVSSIRLDRSGAEPIATGGLVEVLQGWDIGTFSLEPMAYRVTRN
ncbi:DUF3578 domain-containing protein [Hyphomonas sp.]|uniref:MrcB family domain-containing protein n=1 Tax=Hyphomonas sp. TaxID=87 RepID=UPI0032EC2FC8